jgi:formate dehydrogenase subunit gamma
MKSAVEALLKPYVGSTGGLLKALHAVQHRDGYIDAALLPAIADLFNVTKAEVKGVVSFYEDFRRAPAGKHVVRVCQAEACQAVGARALTKAAEMAVGIELGNTNKNETITLEGVACLGLCSVGPAVEIDGDLRGRVDPEGFTNALGQLAEVVQS